MDFLIASKAGSSLSEAGAGGVLTGALFIIGCIAVGVIGFSRSGEATAAGVVGLGAGAITGLVTGAIVGAAADVGLAGGVGGAVTTGGCDIELVGGTTGVAAGVAGVLNG